jgi:ABC-type glycerol-3-phosphate transport system substrate-binding protein
MRRATFVLAALLMTAACGSMGDGGLGSIGDIILGSPSTSQSSDVKGTVAGIDTNARRIDLNVTYVNNLRDNNNGQRGSIYYDNNTTVTYNNQSYNVLDLERGDEIEVRGVADNGKYIAQQIVVVRDAT